MFLVFTTTAVCSLTPTPHHLRLWLPVAHPAEHTSSYFEWVNKNYELSFTYLRFAFDSNSSFEVNDVRIVTKIENKDLKITTSCNFVCSFDECILEAV